MKDGDMLFGWLDKTLLAKDWEKLPKREATVFELELYANVVVDVGINVNLGNDAGPIYIFSEAEFEARTKWQCRYAIRF